MFKNLAFQIFLKKICHLAAYVALCFVLLSCNSSGGNFVDDLVGSKGGLEASGGIGNASLKFDPDPLDFGNVAVAGSGTIATINLRNEAQVPIKISKITPPAATEFSISNQTCVIGNKLAVGETCTVTIQFLPTSSTVLQDKLTIDFSPAQDDKVTYSNSGVVKGTGVAPLIFAGANPILPSEVSTTRVMVRWPTISGATGFSIDDVTGGAPVQVGFVTGATTSFQVTNLSPASTYKFRVRALNVLGVADSNTNDQPVTTDSLGSFSAIPALAASEGSTSTTASIEGLCTDIEGNTPQLMIINSQSDPDLVCSLISSPYRVSCTPSYKAGAAPWSGTVSVGCLLNDYGVTYNQTLTVNVSNTFRPPSLAPIAGQNVTGGQAISPVQAVGTSLDLESINYTCQYDQLVDGSVLVSASACSTLLNQNGTNATFTAGGLLSWTPRLLDANQSFEFKITATGASSSLSSSQIFVINVGYPPPSIATSVISVASGTVSSGNGVNVFLQAKDAGGNNILVGGSTVTFSNSGGTSTGTFSPVTDLGNGMYRSTFTGVIAGSATSISATIQGSTVTTTSPTVQVLPGLISATKSTLNVSAPTVASGNTVTLTLSAKDAAGNAISTGGAAVVFNRSGGTSTGSIGSTTDNGNGTYSAAFTGVLAGTATTIGATVNAIAVTTTLPSVQVTPGAASVAQSLVSVTGSPSSVVAGNSVQVKLTAKDAAGNSISSGGLVVVFSFSGGASSGSFGAVTDNSDGTYTAALTGTTSGSASLITATIGGVSLTSSPVNLSVLPGAASNLTSLISVGASTLASGTGTTLTLQAKDAYSNNISTGGETVVFSRSGGTSTGSISATTDASNGSYTATFTGLVSGTATTIGATIGGTNVVTTLPTITVNPGAASASTSVISSSATTVTSGNSVTITFQAKDAAGNNLTSGGATLVLNRSGGTSTGSFGSVTDNANGTYTASFTGLVAGTATSIGGTINGTAISTTLPTVTVTPGAISAATSVISASSGTVSSGSNISLTLTAKDAAGNQISSGGSTVVFSWSGGTSTGTMSATTDNNNGTYTATFTGVLAGTATTVNATVGGTSIGTTLPTIIVTPGPVSSSTSTVSVASSTIGSGSSDAVTVQAKDAAGNNLPAGGSTVAFTNTGGTSTGSFSATTDNSNGTYTTTFTGVLAGTATTINATINGVPVTTTLPTIQVTHGAISTTASTVTVASASVASGGAVLVTLQAKDAAGNLIPVGGSTIAFSRSGGTSTGTFGAVSDNSNGTYTANFNGVLAGTATTINASIGGSAVTSTPPTITVIPGAISLATSAVSVSSSNVASGSSVTLTLQAKDNAGNNLTAGGATVVFSNTGGTSTGSAGATTDNGNGTYTSHFTGAIAGTATSISATIGGSAITTSLPTVTVLPGPPSAATSLVTVSSATLQSGNLITVTLQGKDAAGNLVTVGGDTITFSNSGGTSTGTFSAVTDLGNGSYTATFTGVLAGTGTTISANLNGTPVGTALPTATVTPGAISAAASTITVASATVPSGTTDLVTLHAKDAAGNNLSTGGATVVFSRTGGTSTGTFSATSDLANGNYTSQFTGAIAGSATTIHATIGGTTVSTSAPTISVTAGTISVTTSVVTVSSATVASGNAVTLTLQGKDSAGNALTAGGSTVVFTHSGGGSTGTISATTDNGNGTYSATFTGVLAGAATTINATVAGSAVTTTLPTIQVLPGIAAAANSVVTVSSGSVVSGNSITLTLQAMDGAGNSLTSGGSAVVFTASGGTSTGNISATTDVGNGTYTATFTGVLAGTATSILATIGGSSVSTVHPTVAVTPGALSGANSTIAVGSTTISSGTSTVVTLQVRDAAGNALSTGGSTVVYSRTGGTSTGSFGAVTDVGNGTYTANFTGTIAGTATTIHATVDGVTVSSVLPTVAVTPGAISTNTSTVSVSSGIVASSANITLTLTAKDAAGNTLSSGGSTVVFSRSGGTSTGSIGATTDNGNGTYSATFTGLLAGTSTVINATIGGSAVTSTLPTVTVTPGVISPLTSLVSVSSSSVASGGSVNLTLTGKDAAGNTLTAGGATIVFSSSGGTSTGSISATTDVGNGTYTATFTGAISGTPTAISATVNASPVTTLLPVVQVNPGVFSVASSLITTTAGTVASGSSVGITLQMKDAAGNNITTGGETVVFSRTGGTSTGSVSATTDNGNGTYTASFTGTVAGTATTITATIGGTALTSTLPTVAVTPGAISSATSLVSVSAGTVSSGNSVTLTLTGKDAAGNTLTAGGSTIVFTRSGGTSTGSIGATTDNGNGTYSATFTGLVSGTATTINATIGGSAVTSTLPTVAVTPGTISVANSLITVSSGTVSSGSSVTLTLTAKDASGNNLSGGGSTVVFTRSGGTSTGSISATTDVGNGTYTATFTGVVSGTATSIGATIGGSPVTTTLPTVTVNPGAISIASSLITIDTSPSSVASGSAVTLRLTSKDSAGNLIVSGGQTVTFTYGGGTSSGSVGAVSDLGNGQYTASFTGAAAGTAITIGGTIGGVTVTSTPVPTITVIPGPPSLSGSVVTVASGSVQSGLTTTVTLTTKDAYGNNLTSGGSTVVFTRSGGSSTGSFAATTDQSNGSYTSVFTGLSSGTPTSISATIGGSPLSSAAPTITVNPGPPSTGTSIVTVSSGTTTSGSTVTLTLTAYDAGGNALTTGGSAVVFSQTGGTSTGTISATTDNNNGTYTATFTGVTAGTPTGIHATIGGSLVGTTSPTITVSPGTISAANSLISVSSASVASGSSVTLTLTAKDSNNNNITSGGQTVVFSRTGGTSTATISGTSDVGNGTYTATFTGIVAGTATTIHATIGGTGVSTTLPTVTVTPGSLSLSQSAVSATSSNIASGAVSTLTLLAKDAAGNNLTAGGSTVIFSYVGGSSTGNVSATSDNGNGTYTATFTGALAGTATTIQVTAGGSVVTSTMPTITVTPGAISLANSIISVSSGTVASGATVNLTLTAKDAAGNQLSTGGLAVVFSQIGGTSTGNIAATVDNNNGTYSSTFNALVAGTATSIRATVGGSFVTSGNPTVTVNPGAVSLTQTSVGVSASSISSGANSVITLTLKDANNNIITGGGQTVAFTRSGGTSTGSIGAVTDHLDGTFTANFTGLVSGTATTISATVNASSVTSTLPQITVLPGSISLAQSLITVSAGSVASGSSVTVTLTAKDANGNQQTAGGSSVIFTGSGGTSTGNFSATTDNGNGTYTATFTGVLAGTARSIGATVGGSAVTSTLPTVTVVPGAVSLANSTIGVSAATIASGTSGTVTLTARDSAGNQQTAGGLTVVFSRTGGTSTGNISATTDNNDGTYTATFNAVVSGTATSINATIGGSAITSTLPTITVVPGTIFAATSTISLSSATVPSGNSITVTLQAKDVYSNNITSGGATVTFNRSGGSSTGNFGSVNDNGNGTYSASFTGLVSGTATTVGGTVNSTAITSTLPTLTVVPGPANLANSIVTVGSSTVLSGSGVVVTLTAKDAGGNTITTGGATVTFSATGGTSTGTFSAVSDNANGTYTATMTGLVAGTPSFIAATINAAAVTSTAPQVQVLVGPFSAANSVVTSSQATVAAGGTTTLTLQAKDINNNNFTSGGGSVTFSISGGTSNGTISGVSDNNNGSYSATFTGTTAGTAVTVGSAYNATSVTSTLPTITVTPGALSVAQSLVSVSAATVSSGNSVTLTLTAKDAYNNAITSGGRLVAFSYSGGNSTGNIGTTTDVGNGTYTASFTGANSGTATTIHATADGSSVTSSLPTVTVNPGTISVATSSLSVSSGSVVSGSTITVTLQAKDAAGNNITAGGQTVVFSRSGGVSSGTFSAVSDNGNGTYAATFTGTTAGSATSITGTINAVSVTSTSPTVTVVPGSVSLAQSAVSLSNGSIASGSTATLTLQAKDSNGNNLTSGGLTVVFTRSGGVSNGTISATTDNGNGTYTATFTGTTAGSATTIGANIGGSAVTSTLPTLTVTPGAISLSQSLVSVSSATVASGSPVTLTLTAKDANGNSLTSGGLTVAFSRSGGTSSGTIGSTTDNGNGTYSAIFTATTAGTATTITSTVGGSAITSVLPTVTVSPGTFSLAQSLVSVSSGTVSSGSAITVTLRTKDAAANNLTSGGLTVAFSRSGGVSTGSFGAVTDNGDGTYTASFTGLVAGSATTIGATISASAVTSALPTVAVTPGAVSLAQSLVALSSATVTSGATVTATLTAKDANNNQLLTGGLSIAFNRSGGASSGSFGAVTDNGDGTYSAVFTASTSGSATTIGSTIGGSAVTSTLPTLTVNPGASSLANSLVTVSSASLASGSNSTLTLTIKDAAGNQLTNGGLAVAFTRSGGTSTGTIGPVTDNGNGTYTAIFTGVVSGSATTIAATIGGSSVTSTLPTITVIPGAVSLAQSTIELGSSSVASGSGVVVTLQSKDSAGNNLTAGGLTVTFGRSGGSSTGSFSSVTDNSNGTYTATFTGNVSGTATSITGTIGGSAITSVLPQLTVTPGSFSLAVSTVSVSSSTIASGSTSNLTLTAKDAAGNQLVTGGLSVGFTYSGGTSTGSIAGVSDNSNGTYTSTFTGAVSGTATTIHATIGGSAISSTLPTITVNPGASTAANSVITLTSNSISAGATSTVTLQAKDAGNNNITTGGSTVVFTISGGTSSGSISAVTDHGNGTYTAIITGTTAGTVSTVGATIDAAAVTSTLPSLTVTPGSVSVAQSTVAVSSSSVVAGNTVLVTLQAKDAYGNNLPSGGLTIVFGHSGGVSSGTFSAVTDNSNGTYAANFQGTTAGTATAITATIAGSTVTSTMPTVTVSAGSATLAQSTLTLSSGTVASGSTVTGTLQAKDAYGNNLSTGGLSVTFFRSGGVSNATFGATTDNSNGTYTVTVTGTTAGSATTIGANISGTPISSSLPTLTVSPGAFSLANSTVSVGTSTLASGSSTSITLQAKDTFGNNLTSGGATAVFSRSGGTSNGTFSAVTDNANGTYTGSFTGTTAGTATTISATINAGAVTSTLPTVSVIPGTVSLAQSVLSVSSGSVTSGASQTVTLTAKDVNGNSLTSGGLTVVFSNSGGTSTGSFSAVSDNFNGTYTANFTGAAAGTATQLRATIGGSLITSALPTMTVTPGAPSLANSLVAVGSGTVASGSSVSVTLTAKDSFGNQQASGGLTVTFNANGGTSTGTFAAVIDNGNGTYTTTFTGVHAGTATSVTGRISGLDLLSAAPTVAVGAGVISAAGSYITASAGTVVSGSTVLITLVGRDAAGNAIPTGGASVAFSRSGGSSTGNFSTVTDNANGTYTANFQGILAGTATTITGTIGGVTVTGSLPTVQVTPGALSLAQSTITLSGATVSSGSSATLTLTSKDANNNLITNGGYTVVFTVSGGTSTGTLGAVNNNLDGTYTASYQGIVAGTAKTITATINGSSVTSTSPTLTVIAGAADVAHSTISVSSPTVVQGFSVTLTLTAKDINDNQLPGGGLTVAFNHSGGGSNGSIGVTSDNANGTYTASFTGTGGGAATTIGATIGGASVTWSPMPTVLVLPLPILAGYFNKSFAAASPDPLVIGQLMTFDLRDTVVGGDTGMSYACVFDKVLDGAVSSGTACTSLPGTAAFNTSSGVFSWTPDSTAFGPYELKFTGTNSAGPVSVYVNVTIQQDNLPTGLLIDLQADFAQNYTAVGSNALPTNTWRNLNLPSTLDGLLNNTFGWTSSSGWAGSGLKTDPYRLKFNRPNSNYVDLGTSLSETDLMVSSWIRPSEVQYTDTTGNGNTSPMIWSNGGLTGNGIGLMQSPAEAMVGATGGPGKLELVVGNYVSWLAAQPALPTLGYRMNEPLPGTSGLVDSIGTNNATPTGNATSAATATGALSTKGDSDAAVQFGGGGMTATASWMYGASTVSNSNTSANAVGAWELWFKTNSNTAAIGGLVAFSSSNTGRGANCDASIDKAVYMDATGNINFKMYNSGYSGGASNKIIKSTHTFADSTWHHLFAMYNNDSIANGGGLYLYIDGVLEASYTDATQPWPAFGTSGVTVFPKVGGMEFQRSNGTYCSADTRPWAGAPSTNRYAMFDGKLDEVYFYSNLTASIPLADIQKRANARRCQSTTVLANNTFYNVTVNYVSSTRTATMFINGAQECSLVYPVGTSIVPSQNFTIGASPGATYKRFWSGGLSDFKVFSSGDSTKALNIYNSTKGRHP